MKRGGCKFGGCKTGAVNGQKGGGGHSFAVGTQAQRVSAPPPPRAFSAPQKPVFIALTGSAPQNSGPVESWTQANWFYVGKGQAIAATVDLLPSHWGRLHVCRT